VSAPRVLRRGDIWWATLDPTVGSEQADRRPVVIVSSDRFQRSQDRLVLVVPVTRVIRGYPLHIAAQPAETGLRQLSAIMCDQLRMLSTERLLDAAPAGRCSADLLRQVDDLLRALIDLP
jgi:mRNA interferase MazF